MTQIPKRVDSQFLVRIIRNEAGTEEKEYFEKWLSESEENKEEFGSVALLWDKFSNEYTPPVPDAQKQWAYILKQTTSLNDPPIINQTIKAPLKISPINSAITGSVNSSFRKKDYGWLIRIAALLVIGFGIFIVMNNRNLKGDIHLTDSKPIITQPILNYEIKTEKGQRTTIPLSDGSIVYLNTDSRLIYPNYFSENERIVELVGEAYFSVKPDVTRPFKVLSGSTTTIVTGTEFNIRNRKNKINVVVANGSVKTFSDKSVNGVALSKGEMVTLTKAGFISAPVRVELDHHLAWRQDKFSFSKTPLVEVMSEIERYYNLVVEYKNDSTKSRTLTGTFKTNGLDKILSVISLTLDLKISHDGKKIYVQ